jgi:O-antigen ligase
MLMILPLALGYLCAALARAMHRLKPAWRDRLLWIMTPEANKLILTSGAIAIMGLALMLTFSRSGISALALALLMMGWLGVRRQQGRWRKLIAAGYLALFGITLVASVGADALVRRFGEGAAAGGRLGIWADARDAAGRHPLTGTGLNTYQFANMIYQRHDMTFFVDAAHNDYLQLAAEGGLLLTIPAAVCIVLFTRDVRRRLREDKGSSAYWIRAGAVTALVAIALQETVEFSLQIPGNAALFAVVSAIALHKSPRKG